MAFPQPAVGAASIAHAPAGFKFRPTDEEVILHYLRPRAVNAPLPSSFIVDVDVLSHNPWELLPGRLHIHQLFFSKETYIIVYCNFISLLFPAATRSLDG